MLGQLLRGVLQALDVVADDAADGVLGGVRLGPDQGLDWSRSVWSSKSRSWAREDVADGRADAGGDALPVFAGVGGGVVEGLAQAVDLIGDLFRRDGPVGDADALGVETRAGPMATPGETAMPRFIPFAAASGLRDSWAPRPTERAGAVRSCNPLRRLPPRIAASGSIAAAASAPSTSSTTSMPGNTSKPIRSQMFFPSARRSPFKTTTAESYCRRHGRTDPRHAGEGRAD